MGESEIKRQVASLNTQLRFGRHQAALTEAYKLRSMIQLSGVRTNEAISELGRAQKVIARLENNRLVGIQKLISLIIRAAKASLSPENDKESTLLDDFKAPEQSEELDEPDFHEEAPAASRSFTFEGYDSQDTAGADGWGASADTVVSGSVSSLSVGSVTPPTRRDEKEEENWSEGW